MKFILFYIEIFIRTGSLVFVLSEQTPLNQAPAKLFRLNTFPLKA
jgi:hypothetical protein